MSLQIPAVLIFETEVEIDLPPEREGYKFHTLKRGPTVAELGHMYDAMNKVAKIHKGKFTGSVVENGHRIFKLTIAQDMSDQFKAFATGIKTPYILGSPASLDRAIRWPKFVGQEIRQPEYL